MLNNETIQVSNNTYFRLKSGEQETLNDYIKNSR